MERSGYWLHKWTDETSSFDPHGRWSGGLDCYERDYSMWIPDRIKPDDTVAVNDYIDRQFELSAEVADGFEVIDAADAQAAIAALQRERDELKELTNVICGHCCEDETEDNAMPRNDFPVLRTYRFSLPEGVVYLELPHPLSVASSDELIQWLSIIEHQVQRSPLTPNEATAK